MISDWHDRKIVPGSEWERNIDKYLSTARIILLLISADFLASDYCYEKEMQVALARHESGDTRVIPVILRAVDWQDAPFGKLQALPKDAKPVANWESRDDAFTSIVQGIRQAIREMATVTQKSSPQKINELLRKFELRPKKYAGQEFVADVALEDSISKIDSDRSGAFSLTLGDAIYRQFIVRPDMKYPRNLYAEGKLADWLEDVASGIYRLRLRMIYGTYIQDDFYGGGTTQAIAGFQLVEVITANSDTETEKT